MRLPFAVIALLLVVLIPLGFLGESDDPSSGTELTPIATIEARVEQLRGLKFTTRPEPVTVTAEQAVEEGLADFDRSYPPERREADEAVYERLGLLPEGTDLREQSESIFGTQVAGYYDPRSKDLRIVEGAAGSRVTNEMIIAHELDHALEDQAIGLDLEDIEGSDDAAIAYTALVEGSATAVMYAYVGEYFDAETGLGGLLADSINAPSTGDLPPFILQSLLFPYVQGLTFVNRIYSAGGDSWRLVDLALRERPPDSSEQVLHPDKWLEAEEPVRVDVPSPGPDWDRVTAGVFGEFQTRELLARGGEQPAVAAAGWGGDRYALYERGDQQALVMRWVHDSARDGEEFLESLQAYADEGLDLGPGGRLPDGTAVAIGAGEGGVVLAFAPDAALARRLSRAQ